MKKVLLCPPKFYDIEYEINPWMHIENKVEQEKVKKEFEELKKVYQRLGVEILEIEQEKGLPDMVYAANFGFPKNNLFIPSNYLYKERKNETKFAIKYFEKLGFSIKSLPDEIYFEGQGDLLTVGGKYFYGYGKRSDQKAKEYLEKFLGASLIDFKLINPYYYHLDTCFAPFDKSTVAINKESFLPEGLETVYQNFPHVIEVSKEDNGLIACNLVVVGKTIVIGKGISQKLKEDFAKFGFLAIEVPMQEYRKGGGSIKCLTLEFH
jgi:N-dimethylarginine dimethylaminohydrolase